MDFDKILAEQEKKSSSVFGLVKGFFLVWVLWACFVLGLIGVGVYIALHFIAKFW